MSTLPIDSARELCGTHGLAQVIVLTWDGSETGVTTFGVTAEDSAIAAEAGNRIKRWLGWPEAMCRTESAKVERLHRRILSLEAQRLPAEELPEDVLDRFLVGRATEGDRHLVINALMVIRQKPPIDR